MRGHRETIAYVNSHDALGYSHHGRRSIEERDREALRTHPDVCAVPKARPRIDARPKSLPHHCE